MEPHGTSASDNRSGQAPTRKPYATPRLQEYGDLAEITKGNSGTMSNDGAAHVNKHFTS
jgi:hypothetical protein